MHYYHRREGAAPHSIELKDWTVTWDGNAAPLSARVPGYAQHDMLDADLLPDPYPSTNEHAWQPACDRDYTYACSFDVPEALRAMPRLELVFDGIDTMADIMLNDAPLGTVDNMYRTWRFDVRELVKPAGNTLRVMIKSPVRTCAEREETHKAATPLLVHAADNRSYLRKMPCSFGWDWGIKLPLSGIWKPVRLEAWRSARIVRVWHETVAASPKHATIKACVLIEKAAKDPIELSIALVSPSGEALVQEVVLAAEQDCVSIKFEIDAPALWWPNGHGAQPLYSLRAALSTNGEMLFVCERRIGVRKLEMVREPDQFGESFFVRVNGMPVFAKGANWIPSDAILSRLTQQDYGRLIGAAADAHMNMLRVWGGGFYEHDWFYDICDELGIMVWQDLMFACNVYPVHKEFLYSVAAEVRDAISRLQHHACIVLWCGNNEVEEMVALWRKPTAVERRDYDLLFEEHLAGVVHMADPSRLYWPSSSHAPWSDVPKRQDAGDTHYWDVWHGGKPFEAYLARTDRFMSEFGFQSFPDVYTVRRYAQPEDYDLESPVMKHHQRSGDHGNTRIKTTMAERYGMPASFADQLLLSQLCQAEAIRMGVEHWRRNAAGQHCMGTLYWQINDNWPVASWASIDYFGRWKALHYAARRCYAPLLVSAYIEEGVICVVVANDQPAARRGRIRWQVRTYADKLVRKGTVKALVAGLGATAVCAVSVRDVLGDAAPGDCYFVADWRDRLGAERCIFHVSMLKDAALRDPKLDVKVEGTSVTVTARRFAKCVCIDAGHEDVQCSDNYFDLLPRESRTVQIVPVKSNMPQEELHVAVRSLYDILKKQ